MSGVRSGLSSRVRVLASVGKRSLTKQSHKKETDINFLMKRYQKTGQVPASSNRRPMHGYFPAVDFMEAVSLVESAREMFSELPSDVRANFDNDPAALLAFVEDPANADRFAEMGLKEAQAAEDVPVQPTASSPPAAPEAPPKAPSEPVAE